MCVCAFVHECMWGTEGVCVPTEARGALDPIEVESQAEQNSHRRTADALTVEPSLQPPTPNYMWK